MSPCVNCYAKIKNTPFDAVLFQTHRENWEFPSEGNIQAFQGEAHGSHAKKNLPQKQVPFF